MPEPSAGHIRRDRGHICLIPEEGELATGQRDCLLVYALAVQVVACRAGGVVPSDT